MTSTVTVSGASGSTVTIPFNSAANGAAAQSALNLVNYVVANGLLAQQNVTTGAPSAPGGAIPLTGAIIGGTTTGTFIMPYGALDIIDTSTFAVTAATAANVTTVVGAGGLTLFNNSAQAQVFFTNTSTTAFNDALVAKTGTTAQVTVDSGTYSNFIDQGGAATIAAYGGGGTEYFYRNTQGGTGGGSFTLNLVAGTGFEAVRQSGGASTIPALTVNGAAGANFDYFGGTSSDRAVLNAGASNVTVIGGAGGSVTLFGGTGSDIVNGTGAVNGVSGYFAAGSGGFSSLTTNTDAGVTTLVGGGSFDSLYNNAAGNQIYGGQGSNVSVYGAGFASIGGALFSTGSGTNGGGNISGNAGGGNTIVLAGTGNSISGSNENGSTVGGGTVHGAGNAFYFSQTLASATGLSGNEFITDFVSGKDVFHLTGFGGTVAVTASAGGLAGTTQIVNFSNGVTIGFTNYVFNSNDFKA